MCEMLGTGDKQRDEPYHNMNEMLEIGDEPRDEPHLNMYEMLGILDSREMSLTSTCAKCWK